MPPTDPDTPFPWDELAAPDRGYEPVEAADADPTSGWEVVEPVACWRCGLFEPPAAGRCRKCRARIAAEPPECGRLAPRVASLAERATYSPPPAGSPRVVAVVVLYTFLLLTSVVWGWVLLQDDGRMTEEERRTGMAVLEAIDTVLVLVAVAVLGRAALPPVSPGVRAGAWVLGVPALALLVGGSLLYASLVRDILNPNGPRPPAPTIDAVSILLMCVQPAVVEELFFRYAAFGVLYRAVGVHTAVWVTAVMFALAHIYNPFGMPYLFVCGAVLGYARVWGGLALPVVMHFGHNFALLAIGGL